MIDIAGKCQSFCWQRIEAFLIAPALEALKVFPIASQRIWGIGPLTCRKDLFDRALAKQTSISLVLMSENSSQEQGGQVSGEQIRAARALLGISSKKLAEASGVGWATIRRFEQIKGVPKTRSGTLDRLLGTLEILGIEFLGDPLHSPGIRLRRKP